MDQDRPQERLRKRGQLREKASHLVEKTWVVLHPAFCGQFEPIKKITATSNADSYTPYSDVGKVFGTKLNKSILGFKGCTSVLILNIRGPQSTEVVFVLHTQLSQVRIMALTRHCC